jgi:hypothetical protein
VPHTHERDNELNTPPELARGGSARGLRRHLTLSAAVLAALTALLGFSASQADAHLWSGKVQVHGSVSSCVGTSTTAWGWFQADTGESGWITWSDKTLFNFMLYRVPARPASTLVTIKWGVNRTSCQRSAVRVIQRPVLGGNWVVGNLG